MMVSAYATMTPAHCGNIPARWGLQIVTVTPPLCLCILQRALHFLLQPESWTEKGLPIYPEHAVVRAHTVVIEQCAMNSYVVHPWQVIRGKTRNLGEAAW